MSYLSVLTVIFWNLIKFWNYTVCQCLQVNKWDDCSFPAVQNERDRISTRRNTFDGCNSPSISTLSQAETLSRQVLRSITKLFSDVKTTFTKIKYFSISYSMNIIVEITFFYFQNAHSFLFSMKEVVIEHVLEAKSIKKILLCPGQYVLGTFLNKGLWFYLLLNQLLS